MARKSIVMSISPVAKQTHLYLAPLDKPVAQSPRTVSSPRVNWRGRVAKKADFSARQKLRSEDRKLRSGRIISYLPPAVIPSIKPKTKKALIAPAVVHPPENNARDYIGFATVYSKADGSAHQIGIRKAAYLPSEECYSASLLSSGKSLGYIAFRWLRVLPNGSYGSKDGASWGVDDGYGFDEKIAKLNRIYVTMLNGSDAYKGVGSALMQAATEWGNDHECEGRISLLATNNSHGFYYKLGMRCHKFHAAEHDASIAAELERAKNENRGPNTEALRLQSVTMYAPQEAIQKMHARIVQNPIF